MGNNTFKHEEKRRVMDNARNLLLEAKTNSRPSDQAYVGWKSDPPNPSGKRPHPHKRFNMEYRPVNIVIGTPSNATNFHMTNWCKYDAYYKTIKFVCNALQNTASF